MAKRKKVSGKAGAVKKEKTEGDLNGREAESPELTVADKDIKKEEVQWALPPRGRKDSAQDESHETTRHAPEIYGQPWDMIRTGQKPFKWPYRRSPIYTTKTNRREEPGGQFYLTRAFCELWNAIKMDTSGDDGALNRYTRTAFQGAIANAGNNGAVAASAAADHPIVELDGDHRVEVKIRDGEHELTAHLDFFRAPAVPEEDETSEIPPAFFIRLPVGGRVTVNGRTFVNDRPDEVGNNVDAVPFVIGPLNIFTIVELLSQPIFFFHSSADFNFQSEGDLMSHRPSEQEIARRDTHGDAPAEDVAITWTPLSRPPASSNLDATSKSGEKQAQYDDNWNNSDGQAIEDPCQYLDEHLPVAARLDPNDILPRVLASINDRQAPEDGFSFNLGDEELTLNPGRTLIAPLRHPSGTHHVLLVYSLSPDRTVTLQILDPKAWQTARDNRQVILNHAEKVAETGSWLRTITGPDDVEPNFAAVSWAECAQEGEGTNTNTLTILNAWAIAMGLHLNPAFRASQVPDLHSQAQRLFDLALHGHLDWKLLYAFLKCQGYVLSPDEADPKGKRKAPKKARRGSDSMLEDDDALPPRNRRFDLRVRGFAELLDQQRARDAVMPGRMSAEEIERANAATTIHLGSGHGHGGEFASDYNAENFVAEVIRPVVESGRWRLSLMPEDLREIADEIRPPPVSAATGDDVQQNRRHNLGRSKIQTVFETEPQPPAPPQSPPQKPEEQQVQESQPDTSEIPRDFDPCNYVRTKLAEPYQGASGLEDPSWDTARIFSGIAPVVRALNELHAPGYGFTMFDTQEHFEMSELDVGLEMHDDCVLYLHEFQGRTFLLLIQLDENDMTVHVIDPEPRSLNLDQRQELAEQVAPSFDISQGITWIFTPEVSGDGQYHYLLVLNAWCILLGLPLGAPNLIFGEQFFDDARIIIELVVEGRADWKLIWAFLRCHEYVNGTEPPLSNRRFTRTSPATEQDLEQHRARMNARQTASSGQEETVTPLYRHFPEGTGLPHDTQFQWESSDDPKSSGDDRKSSEDNRKSSGAGSPAGSATGSQGRRSKNSSPLSSVTSQVDGDDGTAGDGVQDQDNGLLKDNIVTPDLPDDFRPCIYFHERRDELMANEKYHETLTALRQTATMDLGAWLTDEEVSLGVAAITVAITNTQSTVGGFGALNSDTVQMSAANQDLGVEVIRPGRPLIVPLNWNAHFVLLVIALDDREKVQFSVLDCKGHHYREEDREEIFQIMHRIVRLTHWSRPVAQGAPEYRASDCPQHAMWVPVSQQPSDDECGHYVILNAWSVALGLTPNPAVRITWTDDFHGDLLDLEHLARIGVADWRLVYAFLRCHNFVAADQEVPRDRRFAQSATLMNPNMLREELEIFGVMEDSHWESPGVEMHPQQLIDASKTILPTGRPHRDGRQFPSDNWSEHTRNQFVRHLERWGILDLSHNNTQIEEDWRDSVSSAGRLFEQELQQSHDPDTVLLVEQILDEFARYLLRWRPVNMHKWLTKHSCAWITDSRWTWAYFLRKSPLKDDLETGLAQRKVNQDLEHWEVGIAIAAVVEAIDQHHRNLYSAQNPGSSLPFAGGLSVASTDDLQWVLMNLDPIMNPGTTVSRPRRTWIIPLVVSGELLQATNEWRRGRGLPFEEPKSGQGHTILAVLQEEYAEGRSGPTVFRIRFADSQPRILRTGLPFLMQRVNIAAEHLKWPTHRNEDGRVRPADGGLVLKVPQQVRPWACGYHAIINGWILAMGLTPAQTAYTDQIYKETWQIVRAAAAGLLDWRSLVAWFICRNLTVQRNSEDVQENRRFPLSHRQDPETTSGIAEGNGNLSVRASENYVTDDIPLANLTETQVPYDRSTNFVPATQTQPPPPDNQKKTGKKSLERRHEDADSDVDLWYSGPKRTRDEMEGLGFLDEYDADLEAIGRPPKVARMARQPDETSFFGYLSKLFQ